MSSAQTVTETAHGPLALATAVMRLQSVYGISINYEDLPATTASEKSAVEQTNSTPPPSGLKQAEAELSFSYRLPMSLPSWKGNQAQFNIESHRAAADALASLAKNYGALKSEKTLIVSDVDGMFIVRRAYAKQNAEHAIQPITNTKIVVSPGTRARSELLKKICGSLTNATKTRVDCAQALSIGNLDGATSIAGTNVAVYSLLTQLISELNVYPRVGTAYVFSSSGKLTPKQAIFDGPHFTYSWNLRYVSAGFYMLYIDQTEVADN